MKASKIELSGENRIKVEFHYDQETVLLVKQIKEQDGTRALKHGTCLIAQMLS
jgi:hypothetical protein